MKLNPKQAKFVKEYLKTANGTLSAIKAGYSERSAHSTACDLLKRPNISKLVRDAQAEILKKAVWTKEDWLMEMQLVGKARVTDYVSWDEEGLVNYVGSEELGEKAAAVSGFTHEARTYSLGDKQVTDNVVKLKFHDKLKAIETYGRAMGWITTKIDLRAGLLDEMTDEEALGQAQELLKLAAPNA